MKICKTRSYHVNLMTHLYFKHAWRMKSHWNHIIYSYRVSITTLSISQVPWFEFNSDVNLTAIFTKKTILTLNEDPSQHQYSQKQTGFTVNEDQSQHHSTFNRSRNGCETAAYILMLSLIDYSEPLRSSSAENLLSFLCLNERERRRMESVKLEIFAAKLFSSSLFFFLVTERWS